MRVAVIYESLTGNTRRAAARIAAELHAAGHEATVSPVDRVDLQSVADADLVVIGSWTDGIFVVGQRPGRAGRLRRLLPAIAGKRAVVFCTFALDQGRTLEKLSALVADKGADVIGGMAIRRDKIDEGARDFVERLIAAAQTSER